MLSFQGQYELGQDLVSDDNTTNTTMLKTLINQGNKVLQSLLGIRFTEYIRSITTLTDTITGTSNQAYLRPENYSKFVEAYTTVGTVQYPAALIQDDSLWRDINSSRTQSTSDFLQFIYVKQNRIELFPIPSSANTLTLRYEGYSKDLVQDDYNTGTITTITNGSTAVVGDSTAWTGLTLDNLYFKLDNDGQWYKIDSITDATNIVLRDEFQGVSVAAGTSAYTIGQFSQLPFDIYDLPVYYACWKYMIFRKDLNTAREFKRMWDEGVLLAKGTHSNEDSSGVIQDSRGLRSGGPVNPNNWPEDMS